MKSIEEIKKELQAASAEGLPEFIKEYTGDSRGGVKKLVETAEKRVAAFVKERERIEKLRFYEEKYIPESPSQMSPTPKSTSTLKPPSKQC